MNRNIKIAIVGLGQIGNYLYNELNSKKKDKLIKMGVSIVELNQINKKLILLEGLNDLANKGFNRVLVEGGSNISASLIDNDLIDKVMNVVAYSHTYHFHHSIPIELRD